MSTASEPPRLPVRPTPVTRLPARSVTHLCVTLLAVLLLTVGCGSARPSSSTAQDPDKAGSGPMVGRCPVDSPAVRAARTVATVDLDGDDRGDAVRLTAPDGDCPDLLFAKLGERPVAAQLPLGGPPLSAAFGVDLPRRHGALLVTRQDHPRGGFQLRLYAAGDGNLSELEAGGHPLVPFVALDVQEHPLSVDCSDRGVVLTEAVAHEPVGAGFAWDIRRTSYVVDGEQVTTGPAEVVAENVPPRQLAASYENLVHHTVFASCRAAG